MDFLAMLSEHRLLVGDGAMGSQLMARGLPPEACAELWNLERPQAVEAVHRGYVAAGAQYLLTNTFGGNALALARHSLQESLEEISRQAVSIARRAAAGEAAVVGDIGPSGQLLAPLGPLSVGEARDAFAAQVRALARAGVDAIIAETFDSVEELKTALGAAREVCDAPLIASMRFQQVKGGAFRTMMGETPQQFVEAAQTAGCDVVGTNCGQGISTMVGLVREIAHLTEAPVIAQPNAGLPKLVRGRTLYEDDPSAFAAHLAALHEAGAQIIGGCCGTTEEHVRAIRRLADGLQARR